MANNPFSPQSNMSFFGGVNDMSTMLPGGRSTFGSSGPATASAPATAAPAVNGNATAIANAAAALGTGSGSAATGIAASPFAPASNLNFAGLGAASPVTSAASPAVRGGLLPGGKPAGAYAGQPLPKQGPQYAPAGAPGSPNPALGGRPQEGTQAWYDYMHKAEDITGGITSADHALYDTASVSPSGILTDANKGTIDLTKYNLDSFKSLPGLAQNFYLRWYNNQIGESNVPLRPYDPGTGQYPAAIANLISGVENTPQTSG